MCKRSGRNGARLAVLFLVAALGACSDQSPREVRKTGCYRLTFGDWPPRSPSGDTLLIHEWFNDSTVLLRLDSLSTSAVESDSGTVSMALTLPPTDPPRGKWYPIGPDSLGIRWFSRPFDGVDVRLDARQGKGRARKFNDYCRRTGPVRANCWQSSVRTERVPCYANEYWFQPDGFTDPQVSESDLTGRWDLVASYGGWMGDTLDSERGSRTLMLHAGGVFLAEGPSDDVIGPYVVGLREEPGFGKVQLLEFSRTIEFLGVHSEFVVETHGDTLWLLTVWRTRGAMCWFALPGDASVSALPPHRLCISDFDTKPSGVW